MAKISSEYEILNEIYLRHRGAYKELTPTVPGQSLMVPVDLRRIAEALGNDEHELSARIFTSINNKYSYQNVITNSVVYLFANPADQSCRVNFPLLMGVLADRIEERRDALVSKWWPLGVSVLSAILSGIALAKS